MISIKNAVFIDPAAGWVPVRYRSVAWICACAIRLVI